MTWLGRRRPWFALPLVLMVLVAGCQRVPEQAARPTPSVTTATAGRCAPPATYLAKGKPSPCLTPGGTRTADPAVICVAGYSGRVRAELSSAQWARRRAEVMRRYGLTSLKGYTVDHELPLQGGGSNDVANLFPQDATLAKGKDTAENGLHAAMCDVKHGVPRPGMTTAKVHALQAAFLKQWGT